MDFLHIDCVIFVFKGKCGGCSGEEVPKGEVEVSVICVCCILCFNIVMLLIG